MRKSKKLLKIILLSGGFFVFTFFPYILEHFHIENGSHSTFACPTAVLCKPPLGDPDCSLTCPEDLQEECVDVGLVGLDLQKCYDAHNADLCGGTCLNCNRNCNNERIQKFIDADPSHDPGNTQNTCNKKFSGAFCGGNLKEYIHDVLYYAGPIVGGLAILKIIYGGMMYATAAGNPQRITDAKSHIYYALIGLMLIVGMNVVLILLGASPYY